MKRYLTATAAALALGVTLGAPLAAQDMRLSGTVAETFGRQIVLATPEGRVLVTLPDGTATPATGARVDLVGTRAADTFAASALILTGSIPDDAALPQPLRGLGLTEVRTRRDDDGEVYVYARLPGGGGLRAESRGDRLVEVQSDSEPLPDALVALVLPASVRAEPRLADIARLTEIDLDDDISVEGYGADGLRIELEFGPDGRLRGLERERDDRQSLTEAAARERLEALGYTRIGFIDRGGRHVDALAVNPYGETVQVRLDDQGRVERERMWLD